MTTSLIGVHRIWGREVLPPDLRNRFARSLGIGGPRAAETCVVADTLAAATGASRGWKPHTAPDGSHILFTGHIDNRRQLAEELGVSPNNLAQIYARGLAAWGDDIDLRALGQFATITIPADGEEIRLSRSPLVAPPLYYAHDQKRLIVSSFIPAMFATGEVEQKINEQRLADFLFWNTYDNDPPWFDGVMSLPSGHSARINQNGVTISQFYDLSAIPRVTLKSDREYEQAAMALFEEGVEAALDGFAKPGILLSGGFDSQAVASLVVQCRPGQTLEAFTSVPEAGWDEVVSHPLAIGNERPYVEALMAMYPEIRPHWIDAPGLFFEHKQDAMFLLSGGPADAAGNLHWYHEALSQARANGCDVALTGIWGNITFSFDGADSFAAMLRHGHWLQLWKEAGFTSRERGVSRFRVIVSQAILPFVPNWAHQKLTQLGLISADDPYSTWCALNRDYAKKMDVESRAHSKGYDFRPRHKASSRDWREKGITTAETEKAACKQALEMLHGIAIRDPTEYRPFVEFCLGIPDDQYVRDGVTRRLAKRMLKGRVPDMVLDTTGIGMQVSDWHLRLGRMREDLIAEIDRLAQDSRMAEMLNLAEYRRRLVDWNEVHQPEDVSPLGYGLIRAIVTARYIRFVDGQNG